MEGGVEAEPKKEDIPETVDRSETSEEGALMEEASPAQGTQVLFSGSGVKDQAS